MRLSIAGFALVLVAFAAHGQPRDPDDVIAVVLGQEITVEDAKGSPITGLIGDPLIEKFAEDNGIQPTEDELSAFAEKVLGMQSLQLSRMEGERAKLEQALVDESLSAEAREKTQTLLDTVVSAMDSLSQAQPHMNMDVMRPMAMRWVQRWKVFKALYEKYGGRAHYQQAGVEPFDAVRDFLEEQEANGAFTILDKEYEDEFWHYWRTERIHRFVPEGKQRELMSKPWWLMQVPIND